MPSSAPSINMDTTEPGFLCGWAGCPEELQDEVGWIKHVSIHVFSLKPGDDTLWLGPPELNPYREWVDDNQSDGEDDDDDERAFSQINALSSPASTPPQVGLPDSPDLSEKINGPSAAAMTAVAPIRLPRSPGEPERVLSNRTSGSADDVEAELIPASPTPSINASQSANSNQGSQSPHFFSHGLPAQTRSQFPRPNVNRFRRGTFQIRSAQTSLRYGFGMGPSQSPGQQAASQTLGSPDISQVTAPSSQSQTNGNGLSWLNTQAFRPAETQDSYESD